MLKDYSEVKKNAEDGEAWGHNTLTFHIRK